MFQKIAICQQCGTKNHLGEILDNDVELVESYLPRDFVYIEPMQRLDMPSGKKYYIDQAENILTREQYIKTHNIDPEISIEKMRPLTGIYVGDKKAKHI
jgi:hypothetical protein